MELEPVSTFWKSTTLSWRISLWQPRLRPHILAPPAPLLNYARAYTATESPRPERHKGHRGGGSFRRRCMCAGAACDAWRHASSPLRGEPLPGVRRRQVCASAPVAPKATDHACAAAPQSPLKGRDWSAAPRTAEKCDGCASVRQLGFFNCRTPTDGLFKRYGCPYRDEVIAFFAAVIFPLLDRKVTQPDPLAGDAVKSCAVDGVVTVDPD